MKIAIFCGSHLAKNPNFAIAAQEIGTLIAQRGHHLLYGGSNWGYMGLVAQAALKEGGEVTAVIPTIFSQEVIDSQPVTHSIIVDSMAERKHQLAIQSDAYIALPGGIGTLDEITEMMVNNQLSLPGGMSSKRYGEAFSPSDYLSSKGTAHRPVGILNTNGFFSPFLIQLDMMVEEGLLAQENRAALLDRATPENLLAAIEKAIENN